MTSTVDTADYAMLIATFRAAGKQTRATIQVQSRRFAPILVRSAQKRAHGEVEKRIAQSAQTFTSAKGFKVRFGAGRTLGEITRPYEFGTYRPEKYEKYKMRHRISRKQYDVKRRTQRQIPPARKDGRFLYPALAEVTPELVTAYVRDIGRALEP